MDGITAESVRAVFYKKNGKVPKWEEFFNIYQITMFASKKRPPQKTDKAQYSYITNITRSNLYPLQKDELKNQGRFLVAVKRPREPKVYGFTRDRDLIINYIAGLKRRDRDLAIKTAKIISFANSFMDVIGEDRITNKELQERSKQLLLE